MANGSWPGNSVILDATSPAAAVIGIRTRTPSLKCPTARLAGPAGVQAAPSATGNQRRVRVRWFPGQRLGRRATSAAERDHVIVVPVQILAAGHAPWSAHHHAACVADPEPGRALLAVDAQLDGARQQARGDHRERACPAAPTAALHRAPCIRYRVTASAEADSAAVAAIRAAGPPGMPLPVTGWRRAGSGGCL